MSKLTEARIRQIVAEEILRENPDLITDADSLFEAQGGTTTKAAQFVGEGALELLGTAEGRKILAGAFRLPLVLVKYWDEVAMKMIDMPTHVGLKKGGVINRLMRSGTWLTSSPLKMIALPMAKLGNVIGGMDDDLAGYLLSGIRGEDPEEELVGEEEPPERSSDDGELREPEPRGKLPDDPTEPAEPRIRV